MIILDTVSKFCQKTTLRKHMSKIELDIYFTGANNIFT